MFNASKIVYDNGKITVKKYKSTSDTMYQIVSCSKQGYKFMSRENIYNSVVKLLKTI